MIIADCHVHSNFSSDGKATLEQMISQAVRLGLKVICFTDHMDYDYPQVSDYSFCLDVGAYTARLSELRVKYRKIIDIRTGIELGLQTHIKEQLTAVTEGYPFDFVIGSSHVVDRIDPYYPEFWDGRTEEEGIRKYFQSIIDNCKVFQGFSVYGHIDYIVRYTPSMITYKKNTSYTYEKFADILDEVLKTILSHGKGIEVNTSGLARGLGYPHPRTEILKRYRELGGELITIGSDAHRPENLCYDFDRVAALLLGLGYRYYAVYEQGKPIMMKI